MSESKRIERLAPIHKNKAYSTGVGLIGLIVFYAWIYQNWESIPSGGLLVFSLLMASVITKIMLTTIAIEGVDVGLDNYQTMDRSLSRNKEVLSRLASKALPQVNYYYPAIDTYLTPMFSPSAFINLRTLVFVMPQGFCFYIFVHNLSLTAILFLYLCP